LPVFIRKFNIQTVNFILPRSAIPYRIFCKFLLLYVFIISCQREINFDVDASAGQLICASTVTGIFSKNKALNDSNYIDVQVHVLKAGNYNIATDTKNGIAFNAKGKFNDTGTVSIKLQGSGTPKDEGDFQFTIIYGSDRCTVSLNVQPPAIGDAVFTLMNAPNNCIVDSIAGAYVKGIALDSSVSKIFIGVNVIQPGAYNVSTNEVDGYFFSGSGVFETTGNQLMMLNANGTPASSGQNSFNINTSSSSCSFVVDVLDVVSVTSNDYFPLTDGSYWSYEDLTKRHDTMMRQITGTTSLNGIEYSLMDERKIGPVRIYNFRKELSGEYFEYAPVDQYTMSLSYTPAVTDEIYFMNDILYKGTSWESTEFMGSIQGGQQIVLKYIYTCLAKNTTVTLNGKAFANVYILNMRPEVKALNYGYNSTGEDYYYYYARGIGIIYMLKLVHGSIESEWQLKAWDVK
jgi:hypothetical protein